MKRFLLLAATCSVFAVLEASRLKDCGVFGCYEEDESERGISDWWDKADEKFVRDDKWVKKTKEELTSDVEFSLFFDNNHPETSEVTTLLSKTLFTKFDKKKMTKVIIHGWKNNKESPICQAIKNNYLKSKINANIIVVDWSHSSMKFYNRAKAAVPLAAEVVAEMINRLIKEKGLDASKLHIIGHSLGAHVAGLAGYRTSRKPSRVTGLDPARPLFGDDAEKISKRSGDYVDIIHSCGNRLGLSQLLGHVDFFPNKGDALQTGCSNDYSGACSHARSHEIYAESLLNPKAFKAVQCANWDTFRKNQCTTKPGIYVGENRPAKFAEGAYYFVTAAKAPWGLGEKSTSMTAEQIKKDDEDSLIAKMLFSVL